MSKSTSRLAQLIREILSPLIIQSLDFEVFGISSITKVDVCTDFDYVDIYLTVLNNKNEVLDSLKNDVYKFQRIINKKIARRKVPKIRFHLDESRENYEKINELLQK